MRLLVNTSLFSRTRPKKSIGHRWIRTTFSPSVLCADNGVNRSASNLAERDSGKLSVSTTRHLPTTLVQLKGSPRRHIEPRHSTITPRAPCDCLLRVIVRFYYELNIFYITRASHIILSFVLRILNFGLAYRVKKGGIAFRLLWNQVSVWLIMYRWHWASSHSITLLKFLTSLASSPQQSL